MSYIDYIQMLFPFSLIFGSFFIGLMLKPKKGFNRYGPSTQGTTLLKSYLSTLRNFANFTGRTSRSEYFQFFFIFLIISMLTGGITVVIEQYELKIFIRFLYGLHFFLFLPQAFVDYTIQIVQGGGCC